MQAANAILACVVSLVLTLLPLPGRAAAVWQLTQVQMVGRTGGWALGKTPHGAALLKTSNGGRTWRNVSPKSIWPLSPAQVDDDIKYGIGEEGIDFCFLSSRLGWVVRKDGRTEEAVVEHTRDGGRHWTATHFPERNGYTLTVSFRDARHGSILTISDMASGSTRKTLYQTSDAGRTWAFVTQALPNHIIQTRVSFRTASEGWLSAGYHSWDELPFYRTEDGGRHWRLQEIEEPPYEYWHAVTYPPAFFGAKRRRGVLPVQFETNTPGINGFALYQTRDTGRTWHWMHQLRLPDRDGFLLTLRFVDLHTGWALTDQGQKPPRLVTTRDGGRHWRTVYPTPRKLL